MKKPDRWRQANPKEQLTVLLMALEGAIDNAVDGIYSARELHEKSQKPLADIKKLGEWLRESWLEYDETKDW